MNTDELSKIALKCLVLVAGDGASYEEAQAIFSTLGVLMKQINLAPDTNDAVLIAMAETVIREELKRAHIPDISKSN